MQGWQRHFCDEMCHSFYDARTVTFGKGTVFSVLPDKQQIVLKIKVSFSLCWQASGQPSSPVWLGGMGILGSCFLVLGSVTFHKTRLLTFTSDLGSNPILLLPLLAMAQFVSAWNTSAASLGAAGVFVLGGNAVWLWLYIRRVDLWLRDQAFSPTK